MAVFHKSSLVIRQGHPEAPSGEGGVTQLPVSPRLMATPASGGFKYMESSLEKVKRAALQLHKWTKKHRNWERGGGEGLEGGKKREQKRQEIKREKKKCI